MPSVGLKLKKAREKKRLSLEEVSRKTKIHLAVLQALEEDRADKTLSRVYVKGFLKNYAQLLGLSGEELAQEFLESSPGEVFPSLSVPEEVSWGGEMEILPWVRKSLFALTILASVYIGMAGLAKIRERFPFSVSSLYQTLSSKKGSLLSYPFRISSKEPLRLRLRALEKSWVTVTSDGQRMYQGLLTKGKEESWVAKRRFDISVSDGGVVRFELNRKSLGIAGEKGRPLEHLSMTRDGWGLGVPESP